MDKRGKSGFLRRTAKFFLFGTASLVMLIFIVGIVWKKSGSSQWELEIDKNGVQVYSYKAPGSYGKQFKGVKQDEYSLSHLVAALMLDNHSLKNCKEWIPECVDLVVLEPYNNAAQGDAVLWTLELLPPVFTNREYVIKSHAAQNKETKVVSIDILAAANKVPLNNCCIRIKHIHNRWQITPLQAGKVEIQLIQDFNMGGFFPSFLVNLGGAEETYKLFHDQLPALLDKEKYRTARFDYIEEVFDGYDLALNE